MSHRNISLPAELVDKIEEFIKKRVDLGYKSNAEFVKETVRNRLIELERE